MIGYFHGCDPVGTGEIENMDQMSILMAGRILAIIPGLPGLFLSSLFSSTLSTTSSGSNSMTAVIWEDFLKQKYNGMDESKKARLMKVITCIIGIASTLLAFACDYMGGIFNAATTTLGAAAGPLVGLFFLGIFSERANKNGAFAGLAVSSFLMLILSVSNNIEKPYSRYVLPLVQNASNPTCRVFNSSSSRHSEVHISSLKHHLDPHPHLLHRPDWHYGDPSTTLFARTSPFVYAAIGVTVVCIVGYIVSLLFPQKLSEGKRRFAKGCTYSGLHLDVDKETYREMEMLEKNKNKFIAKDEQLFKFDHD
uniref:Uncharacterized protein n=2 Tax=Panagrolaimus davidi TaxID=227884 RepID=A0A914QEP0_9BILA